MRKFTESGRVVYDRKKHLFTVRDIVRIGKKSGSQIFYISDMSFESMVTKVEDAFFRSDNSDFVFGGGSFGGGGATRVVDSLPPRSEVSYKNAIIIVETEYL